MDGIYSPTRVLHGTTNAVTHLQSALDLTLPTNLRPFLLKWLDEILLHSPNEVVLLDNVLAMFKYCNYRQIKLHPLKCLPFAKEARWCVRIISSDGIKYDPRRMQGLLDTEPPTTGSELQQFLCALQWVKNGIPNFSALVAHLHEFMEKFYEHVGKRTKRAVANVQLTNLCWSHTQRTKFENCKTALAYQVTLSHRDRSKRLCVYTDASDHVWSGIFTKVPLRDTSKPHVEQRHDPLAFLSGRFNTTQYGWSILEKEAFAVMATLERMHWLVATLDGFDLFTDQNNSIFIFDPLSVVPDLSQTAVRKVLRWAVRLST